MRHKLQTLTMAAAVLAVVAVAIRSHPAAAETARVVPLPAIDLPPGDASSAVVVLAGGCFWGVQGVYQHVKGVTNAVSGYAGGDKKTADYEVVSTGRTGHAESVQVMYDPRQISYGRLLQIFFSVAHEKVLVVRLGGIKRAIQLDPRCDRLLERVRLIELRDVRLRDARLFGVRGEDR